ncbi:TRAP transporter permease [Paralimibaculum aggregatum]|uniref:TRAP transporter permease n=2 Tax=Paralimibaculum aggregatum TaxID=3036245 RepID=A0ABQ6LIX9_9RHOB|nr:TRAP transporter permease [Limibaculum sp. NKW23]
MSLLATAFAIYRSFNFGELTGYTVIDSQYFYLMLTLLLPLAFLVFPAVPAASGRMAWYDVICFAASLGLASVLVVNAERILNSGWEFIAPDWMQYVCIAFWLLVLEATRRAGGNVVAAIVAVVSAYPLIAGSLPGILQGSTETIGDTAAYHVLSTESVIGIPFRAFAYLVLGFMIFGVALQHTGGGRFFIRLAFALLGGVRGGPAKVAVISSGLMGSMSGSVITNVLTTGALTIPAMRRHGIKPHVAGGIEACASTGGVLMPPVMGATAFIIAINLGVSYRDVLIAAVIPSLLYFFSLFIQIDAYAARMKLKGIPRERLESLGEVLKDGWYYLLVFGLLIHLLIFENREAQAPYYATVLLLVINQVVPGHRFTRASLLAFLESVGRLLVELAGLLAGVGLIVGALAYQSKIGTFAFELLALADGQVFLLLLLGALVSFVMGIGVTVTIAYIILAITMAPALSESGLNPMGVHLFMLYWGMLSYITPPVALGAFAASSIAGASPMRTGFEAMRLGTVIYFIPFFFVADPALLMQGEVTDIVLLTAKAMIGIVIIAMGLQGYLFGSGRISGSLPVRLPKQLVLVAGGLAMAMPGGPMTGFGNVELTAFGAGCAAVIYLIARIERGLSGQMESGADETV